MRKHGTGHPATVLSLQCAMAFATRVGPLQSVYRCNTCKVDAWVPAYVDPPIAPTLPELQQPVAQQQPQPATDEV